MAHIGVREVNLELMPRVGCVVQLLCGLHTQANMVLMQIHLIRLIRSIKQLP